MSAPLAHSPTAPTHFYCYLVQKLTTFRECSVPSLSLSGRMYNSVTACSVAIIVCSQDEPTLIPGKVCTCIQGPFPQESELKIFCHLVDNVYFQ